MPMLAIMLFALLIGMTVTPEWRANQMHWFAAALADDDDDDDDDDRVRVRRPTIRAAAPLPSQAPNEVLARGLSASDLADLEGVGFRVLKQRTLGDGAPLYRLRKPARLTMTEARQAVQRAPSVQVSDFNHFYRVGAGTECSGVDCPARSLIDWPLMQSGCGTPPLIGMVDTGLNIEHEVFANAAVELLRVDEEAITDEVHGTAVAALLVGHADSRAAGLVPHAPLIAVDAFTKSGSDIRADAYSLIEAMDMLGQRGVRVMNLSLAGPHNDALQAQVEKLWDQGVVMVAAAGNGGPRAKPAFPAGYDQVIAVTAVDRRGEVYRRAARGRHIDIAAPGVDVWTAASVSGARTKSGTSFAAPFVTASAALILQDSPALTPREVRRQLLRSARDLGREGRDTIFGNGLLVPRSACAAN